MTAMKNNTAKIPVVIFDLIIFIACTPNKMNEFVKLSIETVS